MSRSRLIRAAVGHLALLIMVVVPSFAQEEVQPVLPDLAPREIEIRGPLQISFPSLERQPLVGFNPPPRVAAIPGDRRPFVEEYKQERVSLPSSGLQEAQALGNSGRPTLRSPFTGEAAIQVGSFFSRLARLRFGVDAASNVLIGGFVDYRGADGDQLDRAADDALNPEEVLNPFDSFTGGLTIDVRGSKANASIDAGGRYRSYTLFGLTTGASTTIPQTSLRFPEPDRDLSEGHLGLGITTDRAASTGGAFSVEGSSSLLSTSATRGPALESTERRFDADASAWLGNRGGLLFSGAAGFGDLDSGESGRRSAYFNTDGMAHFTGQDNVRLQAGAALIGSWIENEDSETRSSVFIAPAAVVEFESSGGFRLFARHRPFAERNMLADIVDENPYVSSVIGPRPTVYHIAGEAGAGISSGPFEGSLSVGYKRSREYGYFSIEDLGQAFDLTYAKAERLEVMAAGSVITKSGFQIGVRGTLVEAKLVDEEIDVPNVPRLVAALQTSAPVGRKAYLQIELTAESSRYADLAETIETDPYIGLRAHLTYEVARNVGITFSAENLVSGATEKWAGYPDTPFLVRAGARFLF